MLYIAILTDKPSQEVEALCRRIEERVSWFPEVARRDWGAFGFASFCADNKRPAHGSRRRSAFYTFAEAQRVRRVAAR